jgi:transposase-like protein
VYLGAGLEKEHSCLLVVIGAREDGRKELLAMELGYRESTESWAGVLRGLRERGLAAPLLAIGDGALGLWAGLTEVFPDTAHQRCWNHKAMNVIDRLPKRLQAETKRRLQAVWGAPTRAGAEQERDATVAWLRGGGQADAAATLLRDWDDLVAFYDYPAEHWRHLRTSNVVESVFAGVRLRTTVAKRAKVRENALYLVFKIVERLAIHWRQLNGGATLMTLLLSGARFRDGVLVEHPARREEVPMAA